MGKNLIRCIPYEVVHHFVITSDTIHRVFIHETIFSKLRPLNVHIHCIAISTGLRRNPELNFDIVFRLSCSKRIVNVNINRSVTRGIGIGNI